MSTVRKLPRPYRAGRAGTAMGRQVQVGDIVPGAHRARNLAECVNLGYLIPVEESELTDEERDELVAHEIQEQRRRHLEANPGHVAVVAGETPVSAEGHPIAPDVILQDTGRTGELYEQRDVQRRAVEHAARNRGASLVEEGEATPAAAEKAAELGVNLDEVEGSGQEGRVTKSDVEKAAEEPEASPAPAPAPRGQGTAPAPSAPPKAQGSHGGASGAPSRPPQRPTGGQSKRS